MIHRRRLPRERWHATCLETLRRQPSEWRRDVVATLQGEAQRHGIVIYDDHKTARPVRIHLAPWVVTPEQCRYLQALGMRLRRTLHRLLRHYFQDPALQAVLPLTDDERAWLSQLAPKGFPEPATVYERFDANLALGDPHWPRTLRLLELNAVGVGCLHFMPIANQLVAEHVLPILQPALAPQRWEATTDPRVLLRRMLEAHARAIGRRRLTVAFVERRETSTGGADEMQHVSQWLTAQGVPTVLADPRDLDVRQGELVYKDTVIDLVYRDFMLSEIVSIEKHGGQVAAMRHAFQHNQVVSALTGEFDHKSLFELLSNPEFHRYFNPWQRRRHRACIPWTRLMRERKTPDPDGREVDLATYVKGHREGLILKPNRAYGGQDVVIGADAAQTAWEEAIAKTLEPPDAWVVQAVAPLPSAEFLDPSDATTTVKEFVTVGFIPTPYGIGFVGRASAERIVNISRGGSLLPIFLAC